MPTYYNNYSNTSHVYILTFVLSVYNGLQNSEEIDRQNVSGTKFYKFVSCAKFYQHPCLLILRLEQFLLQSSQDYAPSSQKTYAQCL